MENKSHFIKREELERIINLDSVVQKLGKLAPPDPESVVKEGDDIPREYVREVIATAKQNFSLFSLDEMGHVWAADFFMQATATDDENKTFAPEAETTPDTMGRKLDPRLEAALKVVSAIVQNSNNYQEALRAGVLALENCIPYVGGIVAAITSLLWPRSQKSAWEQVKDQVEKVVQNAIFENEFNIVQSQITALQTSLNQYTYSPNTREQGVILIATMVLTNSLYERVNQSKYRHMLIGLMAPIGALHLTVLSERYNHYEVLFEDKDRSQALKELESTYTQYKKFFDTVFVEWKDWRRKELKEFYNVKTILWSKEYHYGVKDELGVFNFGYAINDKSRAVGFKEWALNKSIADMADVLSSTESYSTFFKDIKVSLSPILTELDTLVLGPYYWTRLQGTGDAGNTMIGGWSGDKPKGAVEKINIYAYNSIDGLQFIYPDMDGTKVTGGGGASFALDIKEKQCVGAKLDYASGLVFKIQFFFADGSKSPAYGNKGGWRSIASIDATVGKSYKLATGNFAKGTGPSRTKGINGVILTFKRL